MPKIARGVCGRQQRRRPSSACPRRSPACGRRCAGGPAPRRRRRTRSPCRPAISPATGPPPPRGLNVASFTPPAYVRRRACDDQAVFVPAAFTQLLAAPAADRPASAVAAEGRLRRRRYAGGGGYAGGGRRAAASRSSGSFVIVAFVLFGMFSAWLTARRVGGGARSGPSACASPASRQRRTTRPSPQERVEGGRGDALQRRSRRPGMRPTRRARRRSSATTSLVEWRRRLQDFTRKGWRNRVRVLSGPQVAVRRARQPRAGRRRPRGRSRDGDARGLRRVRAACG